ncbi:MAG: threonine--tRNA ligase, partial [Anaerolineales bacterium]|nr:threonine--tRNA ligase [Anaerolineales bacterium]
EAVQELWPGTQVTIGPVIENGFYYDFARNEPFSTEDLAVIEKEMRKVVERGAPFTREVWSRDQAIKYFTDKGEMYKAELIRDLPESEDIKIYRQGEWLDLCRGPHMPTTKHVGTAFKLLKVAGAYWRGDENRPQLQRIYGTAWESKQDLRDYLAQLEEAKKRDHRKIGRELELFIFDEEIGPGLPLWLPNGNVLREELEKLAREMEDQLNYEYVSTPHIAKEELYLRSGHLPYYAADMYGGMAHGETRYYLKPMNCPFHHKIYGSKQRSYRDLPVRLSEYGMVYRYEQSGELFGLMRVRAAQQNDAHIYCTAAQFEAEFTAVLNLYRRYFEIFGIKKYQMRLSKHSAAGLGKKYVNDPKAWLETEAMVRQTMQKAGIPFVEAEDEAAFYGPKIDVQVWSAIGREFSIATNQADFAGPRNFDLVYVDENGEAVTPICIHRAPLGSHERFVGFLIEHYAGKFPVWLAPVQVAVIPVTDRHNGYAQRVAAELKAAGIRANVFDSAERMGRKIRQAQLKQIPYMLIVGDQEVAAEAVSVRTRENEERGVCSLEAFMQHVQPLIAARAAEL